MAKKMHLTGFMLFAPAPHMIMSWVYPREKIRYQWYEPEYWETIAKTLERGKFDMFFFADGWAGGTNPFPVEVEHHGLFHRSGVAATDSP